MASLAAALFAVACTKGSASGPAERASVSEAPRRPSSHRMPNLVVNGAFDATSDSGPQGWSIDGSGAAASAPWRGELAVSSGTSVRVATTQDSQTGWQQTIPGIDPDVRYRLRAHVHASRTDPGSHGVELHWLDAGERELGVTATAAMQSGAWSEVTLHDVVPPPGAASVRVVLRAYKAGTYYFDDVTLTRQDESVYRGLQDLPLSVYHLSSLSLVSNGDMEQPRVSGSPDALAGLQVVCAAPSRCSLPAFWNTWSEGGRAQQTWEATGDGGRALQTIVVEPGRAEWRQLLPDLEPDRRYRLCAKVLPSEVAPGSHAVEVRWLDAEGRPLASQSTAATVEGTWNYVSLEHLVPPAGARSALLILGAAQVGSYLFDEVEFSVEMTNAELLAELRSAGFTLASAYGLQGTWGWPGLDEVQSAGLRAVYKGVELTQQSDADAQRLRDHVQAVASHPALALWMGLDEPAWWPEHCRVGDVLPQDTCPGVPIAAYQTVREADASWGTAGHGVWLNHAPRGPFTSPADFGLLRAFNPAGDVLSMDVYPVPSGVGHGLLPDESPASVGEHVDVLYAQVTRERGRQAKPIWMVNQAFAWDELTRTLEDGSGARYSHTSATLEVHWYDAKHRPVMQAGADGVLRQVVTVLQTDRPNTWHRVYEQVLEPPADARSAAVLLRAHAPGTFWFDDVAFVEEGAGALLRNGSFEEEQDGAPAGWTLSEAAAPGERAWDSTFARSGARAARLELRRVGTVEWRQEVAVVPGRRYRLEGAIYAKLRPTWEETRFMAYDAILHGARGLSWWGNHHVPHNAGVWADVKRVTSELRALSPALLAPASFREVAVRSSSAPSGTATAAVFGAGETLVLVAANPHPFAATYQLEVDGLPLSSAERLFEPPAGVELRDNRLTDHFAPYGVHVYRLRGPGSLSLKEGRARR